MWTRLLLVFSLAGCMRAQQDHADLLRLVQARVSNSLDRLPRYMCTLTIDRTVYWPDADVRGSACNEGPAQHTHLTTSDRLRLDVAKSDVEMYSWVGESRFNDRDIANVVQDGAISDGSFVAFLNDLFRTDIADFTYNGEITQNGRTSSEFAFKVPRENSQYVYSDGQHRVTVGYEGTFLVDPKSGDLLKLAIRTSRLPAETSACYVSTTLDYARARIGSGDFLLPGASLLHILNSNGIVLENHTAFSNCHEFLGESTISFDAPADADGAQPGHAAGSQALVIPQGLPFRVALTQAIDTATAAAGELIRGKLTTPIRNGSKALVPAGAPVGGRIVRIRQFYGAAPYIRLEFRLETVDVGGVSLPLAASPDNGNNFPKADPANLQRRVELGNMRGLQDRSVELVFRGISQPYVIESGLESGWLTAAAAAVDSVSTR
ncbi:MAG: hypothetical protein ABSG41_09885 [Bryobacteraceae bacterium]|jgi:hypothetical protein